MLEQFGSTGPTSQDDMQKCVDALNKSIDGLPPGDPVAAELKDFKDKMCKDYGFTEGTPGRPLTPKEQKEYDAIKTANDKAGATTKSQKTGSTNSGAAYQHAIEPYVQIMSGTQSSWDSSKAPKDDEWKGTTDALGTIVGDIKSNSEIQMLQLQDLVSQRQQAVSLASGMMSKEDTSLEQLARLGQG